ncbi:MAG: hypothetical protein ACRCXB_28375 [Aeromonadaceae bacterium]
MSYAINATGTGWRSIDSADDLLQGETFSETEPVLELVLTYAQELTALTAPYNADRDTLCAAWLRAAVADGTEETVRKEDVESEIAELDAQYDADVAALKIKYGVN